MKRLSIILVVCIALSPVCLAESTSPADDFLAGLSQAWGGLMGMASEAGQAVSDWADENGITEWIEGASQDVSAWLRDSGLTDWANSAVSDITAWANESGIVEWTESAAANLQAFVDENGPAVEAWLAQAGEEVRQAWNALIESDQHTKQELQKAYETVVGALEPPATDGFKYVHDPRENPEAMKDIVVNPDAVYGFSPSPDSTRLKDYVDAIDWTDPQQVADARAQRQVYFDSMSELYRMIEDMLHEGKNVEEIARAVSKRRNELRLEAYKDDPDGLALAKKSNLDTYGDEMGPSADSLYEKYGSWQRVLEKALGTNEGMDACLGFYDEYYDTYDIG